MFSRGGAEALKTVLHFDNYWDDQATIGASEAELLRVAAERDELRKQLADEEGRAIRELAREQGCHRNFACTFWFWDAVWGVLAMNNDLHAKALRGYAWLLTTPPEFDASRNDETGLWDVTKRVRGGWNEEWETYSENVSDSMFIAFCEDRGWQDAEDEGVEWVTERQNASIGTLKLQVTPDYSSKDWCWSIHDESRVPTFQCRGYEPTRAEARRAAIEAARGLG
jgi:hypothetical protein